MMTIRQIYDQYIYSRSTYCSAETIEKYSDDLRLFFRFLEHKYKISVDVAGFDALDQVSIYQDYLIYCRKRKIKDSSVRSYARSIKAFLRYCYDEDYCKDYLKKVKMPKSDAAPVLPLFEADVIHIDTLLDRDTEQGLRNYCIFHLMLDCGLRRQEVVHLQVHDLNTAQNILSIKKSKGNKSRFVLIPDFLITALQQYFELMHIRSGAMFLTLRTRKPISYNTIKMFYQDMKVESGIDRLHGHLLRHTFAISFLIGGGNLEFLRVFMGHFDYVSTKTYVEQATQLKILGAPVYKLDPIFFKFGY